MGCQKRRPVMLSAAKHLLFLVEDKTTADSFASLRTTGSGL
jgi:hypothetical protein